ncbi:L-rhamnose-binding lectin SML-like isoform X1 [Sphaeramia orbicularis]|uniref:L-rhamnose-binding lectin SML-like isoform X1 n=1 Tax=Sphaeramia orbicularis TaxID=375764 RepID=UPI00117C9EB6|nr:L-rhamnose-binding lectin SML-like isoform X1 [Sphaeramia orbicularis]
MLRLCITVLLAAVCLLLDAGVSATKVTTCGAHVQRLSCVLAAACLLFAVSGVSAVTVTTCGPHVQRLSCDSGVIDVQLVLYGRNDHETCATGKAAEEVATTDCSLADAQFIVRTRCNGKTECELNHSIFATDPCPNIFKYLKTTYTCIPAKHLVVCEQSFAHLECDENQVISVIGADFGRRDGTTCSFRRLSSKLVNTQCISPTNKVAEKCNGKNSCSIRAASSVFGDPCLETYKYLEVAYTCQG